MAADLLGLFEEHGLNPKKKTASEWGAACPACGGTDRCMVKPDDHGGRGGYRCRQCGTYGDNIQFLRDFQGMSYGEACRHLGIAAARATAALPKMPRKSPGQQPFESAPSIPPAELWAAEATNFCAWCHAQLLENPEQLAWLEERGLPLEAVQRYRLGWNPGERGKSCLNRPRSVWGLPIAEPKPEKDGTPGRPKTTFWIPRGLVIPQLDPVNPDGPVLRLRIRRPEADRKDFKAETKYYVIPGSSMDAMILGAQSRAFVVVESELDALMLHHQVGDLAGAVSVMTSNVRKIESTVLETLSGALAILVSLDADEAGAKGWESWQASFPRTKRWPCPLGKDPGEAFALGANLRAWIVAGLPPVLRPGLLPPGLPVLSGEGGAKEAQRVSSQEIEVSTGSAREVAEAAPVSPSLPEVSSLEPFQQPAWLSPVTEQDLDFFDCGRAVLLELTGLMRRLDVRPVLLRGKDADRLALWAAAPAVTKDDAAWSRVKELFFGVCLSPMIWLIQPDALRLVRGRSTGCHGVQRPGQDGEWFPCVKMGETGMDFTGWQ